MRIISTNFFKRYNPPSSKRETIRLEQETTQLLCVVTIPERRFQACEISRILARINLSSAEKQIWRIIKIVSRPSWSASLCNKERSKRIWEEFYHLPDFSLSPRHEIVNFPALDAKLSEKNPRILCHIYYLTQQLQNYGENATNNESICHV